MERVIKIAVIVLLVVGLGIFAVFYYDACKNPPPPPYVHDPRAPKTPPPRKDGWLPKPTANPAGPEPSGQDKK